jgi:hypothetical protein
MPRKSSKVNSIPYKFDLKKLCTPSFIYFLMSLVGLILLGVQNLNGEDALLCVGNYNCNVGNKTFVFIIHAIYILFWTFVLDLMCKAGYKQLSWIILLVPILLSFLFLGIIIYQTM